MDEKTMYELLVMHDAVDKLYDVEGMFTGTLVGVGPGEGILGDLSYVTEIIMRYSPIYEPGHDLIDSAFGKVLYDEELDNHRKARILLGIAD